MSISPTAREVVIDDTDSRIVFSDPQSWFMDATQDTTGNYGPPYLHTLHATQSNTSLSFSFSGTNIILYGLVNVQNVSGIRDPSWECFIDGISTGKNNNANGPLQPENNWPLCSTLSPFTDGQHQVTLNVTTQGSKFWFDDLKYVPSPTVPLNNETLLIDDSDSNIQYRGWNQSFETASFTQTAGATMSLTFTGNSLSWYAFIPSGFSQNATNATYSIDGGKPQLFNLNGVAQFNSLIFQTPQLSLNTHNISVVYHGSSDYTPLWLDYLLVNNATLDNSSFHSEGHSNHKQLNIGGIVGGVVGGLVVILLLFYLARRRSNQKVRAADSMHFDNMPTGPLTPHTPRMPRQFARNAHIEPFIYSPLQPQETPLEELAPLSSPAQAQFTNSVYTGGNTNSFSSNSSTKARQANSRRYGYNDYTTRGTQAGAALGTGQLNFGSSHSNHTPNSASFSGTDLTSPLSSPRGGEFSGERSMGGDITSTRTQYLVHADSGVRIPPENMSNIVELPPGYTYA